MALERVKMLAEQVAAVTPPSHPFDPLSAAEIEKAVSLVSKEHGQLAFNAVTVQEPRKKDMLAWLADPKRNMKPHRIADVVAIRKGGIVYDGLVDLDEKRIIEWTSTEGIQPLVSQCESSHAESRLRAGRLRWRISRLLNTSLEKIPRSLSNA